MAINNENIQDLVMFVLTNNRLPEDGDLFIDGSSMKDFLKKNLETIYKNEDNDSEVNLLISLIENIDSEFFSLGYREEKDIYDDNFRNMISSFEKSYQDKNVNNHRRPIVVKERKKEVHKLNFFDFVRELTSYIEHHNELPGTNKFFSDGKTSMKYFLVKNKEKIYLNKKDRKDLDLLKKTIQNVFPNFFSDVEISDDIIEDTSPIIQEKASPKKNVKVSTFDLRLQELYYDIIDSEKYGYNCSIRFSDGAKKKEWVMENISKLMEINNAMSNKVLNYYFKNTDSFSEVVQEVCDYLDKNNYKFPFEDMSLNSGGLFSEWFKSNRNKIDNYVRYNDSRVKLILGCYYASLKSNFENMISEVFSSINDGTLDKELIKWVNDNGDAIILRQKFDDRLVLITHKLLTNYITFDQGIKEVTALFNKYSFAEMKEKNIRLSNGILVKTWISKRKSDITCKRFSDDVCDVYCNIKYGDGDDIFKKECFLNYEAKLYEAFVILKSLNNVPRRGDNVRFSDGTNVGNFLDFSKSKIYESDNLMAQVLAARISKMEPHYYDETIIGIEKRMRRKALRKVK